MNDSQTTYVLDASQPIILLRPVLQVLSQPGRQPRGVEHERAHPEADNAYRQVAIHPRIYACRRRREGYRRRDHGEDTGGVRPTETYLAQWRAFLLQGGC